MMIKITKWTGSYIKPTYNRSQVTSFFSQDMVGTNRSAIIGEIKTVFDTPNYSYLSCNIY